METLLRRLALAVHPSVIKRHRQSLKRKARNQETRSKVRTLLKKARHAVSGQSADSPAADIKAVNKALGKAVSKGIINRNTASRWLSRLARAAARTSPSV
jgi:small subunit ribosomal protein S20